MSTVTVSFQNALKRVKSHNIAYQTSEKLFAAVALPQTQRWVSLLRFYRRTYGGHRRVSGLAEGHRPKRLRTSVLSSNNVKLSDYAAC